MTPERCLKCSWWNHNDKACERIFKAQVIIVPDAGEITLETQRGLLPEHLDQSLSEWVCRSIGDVIDAWPGWAEWKKLKDSKGCAGHKDSVAIKEFGVGLKLVRPISAVPNGIDDRGWSGF